MSRGWRLIAPSPAPDSCHPWDFGKEMVVWRAAIQGTAAVNIVPKGKQQPRSGAAHPGSAGLSLARTALASPRTVDSEAERGAGELCALCLCQIDLVKSVSKHYGCWLNPFFPISKASSQLLHETIHRRARPDHPQRSRIFLANSSYFVSPSVLTGQKL